ncbi:ABC transporter permease [Glutamicibacter sp.]|uniref:ABC transporter permease n=1 Tax=Glutamicibacter sp. TaxID=1931995 RepID=UPI002B4A93E2|nr:ABC transporter permease [Glutamicibacter sp.]HJX78809.1 ABC transporter permease [Glutamicibacter sp.]
MTLQIGVPVFILAIWWAWSNSSSNPFFPPLSEILVRFRELWLFDKFLSDIVPSLSNLVIGFAIAVLLGVILGLVFALVPVLEELLSPLIHFYRAVPSIAIIPVFISLMGFGNEVRLLVIILAAFPPTWIATMDGIKAVEPQLHEVAKVFRITNAERVFGMFLPSALPQIFTGLQASLQFSFVVMIATEMLGSSVGIGAMTILAQQSFASVDMWAGIVLLGVIGFLSNYLLGRLRARVLSWYDKSKALQLAA